MKRSTIAEFDVNSKSLPGVKRKLGHCVQPYMSSASSSTCEKRRKNNNVSRSLIHCYANFLKSGLPNRIMINQNGGWTDFPPDIVNWIRNESHLKGFVKVELDGRPYVLDFVQKIQLDMETGLRKSIAWIDEAGKFFFPERIINDYETPDFVNEEICEEVDSEELRKMNKIELQIDIDINNIGQCNLESTGESNIPAVFEKPDCKFSEIESARDCHPIKVEERIKSKHEFQENIVDPEIVRIKFLSGMKSIGGAEVKELYRCSTVFSHIRLEIFEKQIELIRKYRGYENVRFAWLPSSKESLPKIEQYGVGYFLHSPNRHCNEFSVPLSGDLYSHRSALCCDVDENGLRHMVFCRVIMGNMKLVDPEKNHSFPSSAEFDSGVDDLNDPKQYLVWNMNLNTHIYPEFVVSFKLSAYAEGFLAGIGSKNTEGDYIFSRTSKPKTALKSCTFSPAFLVETPQIVNGDCFLTNRKNLSFPFVSDNDRAEVPLQMDSCDKKVPNSPWLPFPLLFDEIANKVSAKDMQLILSHYETFKVKEIDRREFVKRLRMIVGDSLLKSTILSMPCKTAPNHQIEVMKPNV